MNVWVAKHKLCALKDFDQLDVDSSPCSGTTIIWAMLATLVSTNLALLGRMIAAFGSGASYSLVSGITQGNKFQGAFTTGVLFAAFQGALHKVNFGLYLHESAAAIFYRCMME